MVNRHESNVHKNGSPMRRRRGGEATVQQQSDKEASSSSTTAAAAAAVTGNAPLKPNSDKSRHTTHRTSSFTQRELDALVAAHHQNHELVGNGFWGMYTLLVDKIGLSISPPLLESALKSLGIRMPVVKSSSNPSSSSCCVSSPCKQSTHGTRESNNNNVAEEVDTQVSSPIEKEVTYLPVDTFVSLVTHIVFSKEYDATFLDSDRSLMNLVLQEEHALWNAKDEAPQRMSASTGSASGSTLLYNKELLPVLRCMLAPHVHHNIPAKEATNGAAASPSEGEEERHTVIDVDGVLKHLSGAHHHHRSMAASQKNQRVARTSAINIDISDEGSNRALSRLAPELRRQLAAVEAGIAIASPPSRVSSASSHSQVTGSSSLYFEKTDHNTSPGKGTVSKLTRSSSRVSTSFMHQLDYSKRRTTLSDDGAHMVDTSNALPVDDQHRGTSSSRTGGCSVSPSSPNVDQPLSPTSMFLDGSDSESPNIRSPVQTSASFTAAVDGHGSDSVHPPFVNAMDGVSDQLEVLAKRTHSLLIGDASQLAGIVSESELRSMENTALQQERRRSALLERHESVQDMFEHRKRPTRLNSLVNSESVAALVARVSVVSFASERDLEDPNPEREGVEGGTTSASPVSATSKRRWARLRRSLSEQNVPQPSSAATGAPQSRETSLGGGLVLDNVQWVAEGSDHEIPAGGTHEGRSEEISRAETCSNTSTAHATGSLVHHPFGSDVFNQRLPSPSTSSPPPAAAARRMVYTPDERRRLASKRMLSSTLDREILSLSHDSESLDCLPREVKKTVVHRCNELLTVNRWDQSNETSLGSSFASTRGASHPPPHSSSAHLSSSDRPHRDGGGVIVDLNDPSLSRTGSVYGAASVSTLAHGVIVYDPKRCSSDLCGSPSKLRASPSPKYKLNVPQPQLLPVTYDRPSCSAADEQPPPLTFSPPSTLWNRWVQQSCCSPQHHVKK